MQARLTAAWTAALLLSPAAALGQDGVSLRAAAALRGIDVAAGVTTPVLSHDLPFRATAVREFAGFTLGNELKWEIVHPGQGDWNFRRADRLVAFAAAKGKFLRAGPLAWHLQNPGWLERGKWTRAQAIELLRAHIHRVVGRYRGRIAQWDVVNEAIRPHGGLRRSVWMRTIGPAYIPLAFIFAREADPSAQLYYNEFDAEGTGPKSDEQYQLMRWLLAVGAPVDGVGLQMHITPRVPEGLASNIARLEALGLKVIVTEMDVRLHDSAGPEALVRQANAYRSVMQACVAARTCDTFVIWGVGDLHTWIRRAFPGFGRPLLFDSAYRPKPAYTALREGLGPPRPLRALTRVRSPLDLLRLAGG